ncbi:MAG: hypothetical protein CME61_08370 [Halobacteriovoraceae bacterium]|nr:hypothetical protein [Halobacteriovoraceae bacterium]
MPGLRSGPAPRPLAGARRGCVLPPLLREEGENVAELMEELGGLTACKSCIFTQRRVGNVTGSEFILARTLFPRGWHSTSAP